MRIENRRMKIAALLGFFVACMAMFFFLYRSAGGSLPFTSKYEAKVLLPTSFNLVPNGDVRRAGVKIGKVTDITNEGGAGLVTFELDDDQAPIYKNATVLLRTKTLVGENYLDLNPGTKTAGKLDDGGTISLQQATKRGEAVQLDQILDTLNPATRREIRRNLDGLGPGFGGHGDDANRLFAALKPTVVQGGIVARILADQKSKVADLVDNAAKTMQAFGDRTAQVRTLARQAKTTAQTVAGRDQEFQSAINELDPTLRQARSSVNKLAGFSGRATPVIHDMSVASAGLTPLMKDLRPAAYLGRQIFDQIPPLTKNLDPLLTQLKGFSPKLQGMIQPLDSVLRQANPALDYLTPYQRDIGAFFGNVGSAVDYQDNHSNLARVFALLGPNNVAGILTDSERKALNALIKAGVGTFFQDPRNNGYPKPGTGGKPNLESNYKQVQPDKASVGG